MCNRRNGMRPEVELSDLMNWDISLYVKLSGRISGMQARATISRALGGKLFPDPGVTETPETGSRSVVKLAGLGGVLTSRRDMKLSIDP